MNLNRNHLAKKTYKVYNYGPSASVENIDGNFTLWCNVFGVPVVESASWRIIDEWAKWLKCQPISAI